MKKFDMKKLTNAKWIGYAAAGVAAIAAFSSTIADQKKEKAFDELVERVSKLENK